MNNTNWVIPKNVKSTFDQSIAEDMGAVYPIECKRCGKKFIRKYPEQIFCSRKCVSLYRTRMNAMEEKYGDKFNGWLEDKF